jgi:pyruvate/2-oxoglutarate dehydrogenase complex dihydrolipoamide acyltransferase (E2) component
MFGKRSDGTKVTGLDGTIRMLPLFAPSRADSVNYIMLDIDAAPMDAFIEKKKAEEGEEYTYMGITIAVLVRLFAMYPKLNRFAIGGQIWQRKWIELSMLVKKTFRPGAEETSLATRFTGFETIQEIKKLLEADVDAALHSQNEMDGSRDMLAILPLPLLKIAIGAMKLADRYGLLTEKFLRTLPFHCSFWVTNLKSIGLQAITHHLFDFGNCGFFLAMGKESYMPKVNPKTGAVESTKIIQMGISTDGRTLDGQYFSYVLKAARHLFANPSLLEIPLRDDEIKER